MIKKGLDLKMAYLYGEDRYQTSFIINCLDDFIDENNSVRIIDAFVNMLYLKNLGFIIYEDNKPDQVP